MAVANDPIRVARELARTFVVVNAFSVDMNSLTYPGPWQNRRYDHG